MTLKNLYTKVAAATLLTGAMLSTPAMANGNNGFSALQGLEAQALSAQEMQAISGELNAYDIAQALGALALKATDPRVIKALVNLSNYYFGHADSINAYFDKLGILTPCKSCAPI